MLKQEIILMGHDPICEPIARSMRRSNVGINSNLPSHDPYIPRTNSVLFECAHLECRVVNLKSIAQVAIPSSDYKSCFQQLDKYECDTIKYNNLVKEDKLLFLANHIPKKSFYLVDCLIYSDGGRVCHKKDSTESYTKLVDTGTIARPKETNVLSQNEFVCEEGEDKVVNCDLDMFVPFEDGLRLKESSQISNNILLKTGSYVVVLKRNCIESWCGFSGRVMPTRRVDEVPGGFVYKCYYANKQQICKLLYTKSQRGSKATGDWMDRRFK